MITKFNLALQAFLFASLVIIPPVLVIFLMCIMAHTLFGTELINPMRLFIASFLPLVFIAWGNKRKSLSISGSIVGYFVGFIITLSNYTFLSCLMAFFVSSSKATRYKSYSKKNFEEDFKEGGQRNWAQVLSNGIVATFFSALFILDCGCSEHPVDLRFNYRCSWLILAVVGAFCCSNGDTWASELGTVLSSKEPFLITTFRRVPKGTNGGISYVGLLMSFLGGVFIGISFYSSILLFVRGDTLNKPQWPILFVSGLAGLLGSLLDSLLGATLQYSGIAENGRIVERPGEDVKHISGIQILDNHSVNLLSTLITALITPYLGMMCM